MKLWVEQVYPYIAAGAATAAWMNLNIVFPVPKDILGSSITIGSIIAGFMGTAQAILMSLDRPIMKRLQDAGYLSDLTSYLGSAIWLSFAFSALALIGYFDPITSAIWFGPIWIFLASAAGVAFLRITHLMLQFLKHPEIQKEDGTA